MGLWLGCGIQSQTYAKHVNATRQIAMRHNSARGQKFNTVVCDIIIIVLVFFRYLMANKDFQYLSSALCSNR